MRPPSISRYVIVLGGIAGLLLCIHLLFGGTLSLSFGQVWSGLISGNESLENTVIWQIRFPRALAGLSVGIILGSVGGVFRTYFRNPLAEPYVLGVASGAAALAALTILFGLDGIGGGMLMPVSGVIGGLITLGLVWWIGGATKGKIDFVRVILSGVLLGSLLSAAVTLILLLAGQDTNQVLRWLLGSLTPMYWPKVGMLLITSIVGSLILYRHSKPLNAVGFDGFDAERLGVDVRRLSLVVLGFGTAMVGIAVGSVGIIGFIGLVAPHIARGLVGPDLRRALPVSALVGGNLVLLSDFVAQKLISGTELPVGAIAALIGAPILFFIALRGRFQLA